MVEKYPLHHFLAWFQADRQTGNPAMFCRWRVVPPVNLVISKLSINHISITYQSTFLLVRSTQNPGDEQFFSALPPCHRWRFTSSALPPRSWPVPDTHPFAVWVSAWSVQADQTATGWSRWKLSMTSSLARLCGRYIELIRTSSWMLMNFWGCWWMLMLKYVNWCQNFSKYNDGCVIMIVDVCWLMSRAANGFDWC